MKFLILTLVLLSSCAPKIRYAKGKEGEVFISPDPIELKEYKEIKWKVGPRLKQRVSKGVFVRFTLPIFESEDLRDLIFKNGVDSWLIHIRKKDLGSSKIIKRVFLPFIQQGVGGTSTSKQYVNQHRSINFSLLYTSASQPRWSKRPCPPFDHNARIEKMSVERSPRADRVLILNNPNKLNFIDDVLPYSFKNQYVDAGKVMIGEYSLEIALYSSTKKKRRTEFFTLGDRLKISNESNRLISGCENYNHDDHRDLNIMDSFKFGR